MFRFLLILSLLIGCCTLSFGQKTQSADSLSDKIASAINQINEKLAQEEKWEIKRNMTSSFTNEKTKEKVTFFNLQLKSKKNFIQVEIVEAESKEKAHQMYEKSVSEVASGFREKTIEYGDGGTIITDLPRDIAASVGYTKANYYVSVYGGSLDVAKEFAKIIESCIAD